MSTSPGKIVTKLLRQTWRRFLDHGGIVDVLIFFFGGSLLVISILSLFSTTSRFNPITGLLMGVLILAYGFVRLKPERKNHRRDISEDVENDKMKL